MVYGYIRVSTDKQCAENQRYEIQKFCDRHNLHVDVWTEETVSGTKKVNGRKLGTLLKKMKKSDILICTELSRLARSMLLIMSILNRTGNSSMDHQGQLSLGMRPAVESARVCIRARCRN